MTHPKHPNALLSPLPRLNKEDIQEGFIMLVRSFLDWRWFHDKDILQFFIYLMLSVNYKDKPFQNSIIHRGEIATSYGHLSRHLDKSVGQIRGMLKKLKSTHDVVCKRDGNHIVIQLVNYNKIQGLELTEANTNNKLLTDLQQTCVTKATITKERENINNFIKERREKDKEEKSVDNFSASPNARQKDYKRYHFDQLPPNWSEISTYYDEKGMTFNLEGFYNYYQQVGWCEKNGKKLAGWHFAMHVTQETQRYL